MLYGVFAWNWRHVQDEVNRLEADGVKALGYELPRLAGYEYADLNVLKFLDYSPECLVAWKQKADEAGKEFTAEIFMPEAPKEAFSEQGPEELPKRKAPRKKTPKTESNSANEA
ncbi:MAG: hypothetical protein AAGC77_06530 [Pseudomonadota bacterium]